LGAGIGGERKRSSRWSGGGALNIRGSVIRGAGKRRRAAGVGVRGKTFLWVNRKRNSEEGKLVSKDPIEIG